MAPNNRTQPGRLDFVKLGHPTNLLCKNQPDGEAEVHAYLLSYVSLPGSTCSIAADVALIALSRDRARQRTCRARMLAEGKSEDP